MGSFNLAFRPKASARSEPGSAIHKPLNAPKVTKHTTKAAKTDQGGQMLIEGAKNLAEKARESVEVVESCKQMCQETCPIISPGAQTDDIIMTDVATDNAVLHNDNCPATKSDLDKKAGRKTKSFTLKDYLPKVRMTYNDFGYGKGQKHLLGNRKKWDLQVLRAIWSQQDTGDKNIVQALIAPAFNHAVLKINHEGLGCAEEEEWSFQGGDTPEDNYSYEEPREEDIMKMWDTFLRELWYGFPKTSWVRKLDQQLFVRFFSLLADARLRERCYPKIDGREHPELVRSITRFLDVAGEAGTPWMLAELEDSLNDFY